MKSNIDHSRLIKVIFVLFLMLFLLPNQIVAAQDADPAKIKGLTLSPLRNELEVAPGTSLDGILTVTNSTDKPMVVQLSAEEFSVINQQYDYAFTAESNVAKWVTFKTLEVDLGVGESSKVMFTVSAPLSAEPGGRYISLFASTDVKTSDSGVSSRQRIASLLYITVIGDVTRSGNLISLSSPWLAINSSTWGVVLQNTGSTHFRSRYNIQVMDLFGGEVTKIQGDVLVLPGTVRAISNELPLPQMPGIYKVVYNVGLGDTAARVEIRYILYMPLIAIIILIAVVVPAILWLRGKKLRKY